MISDQAFYSERERERFVPLLLAPNFFYNLWRRFSLILHHCYVCLLLIDITKCFDKIRNSALIHETLKIGVNPEPVKFINDLSSKTVISMSNMDKDHMTRTVTDTAGQGQDFACLGTGFTIGKTVHNHLGPGDFPDSIKIGNTTVPPRSYVDDNGIMTGNPFQLSNVGKKVTDAFNDLAININPKKTKVIVIGNGKKARKMRESLLNDPVTIQGHQIQLSDGDTYLGMKLSQAGINDSIKQTFDERTENAWRKLFAFKKMIRHPVMQKNGFIKSAVALFRAAIIPTLLYSCESWVGITKGMLKLVEKTYKKMIYSLLDIPTNTNYFAVLHELGLKQARHIIAAQKINFVNNIAIYGRNHMTHKVLTADHLLHSANSIVSEIKTLCAVYDMPSVWEFPSDKDTIRSKIDMVNDCQLWKACFKSSIVVTRLNLITDYKPYHFKNRFEGRAILLWRCGSLRFRYLYRKSYIRKSDKSCPHDLCGEDDTFRHATKCPFMRTKLSHDENVVYEDRVAQFLIELNRERLQYGLPVL